MCGQQRHLKLSVSPSCLELILAFYCFCSETRKRTKKGFYKRCFSCVSTLVEIFQMQKCYISRDKSLLNWGRKTMWDIKEQLMGNVIQETLRWNLNEQINVNCFWPVVISWSTLFVFTDWLKKKKKRKQSIICFPKRFLITLSNICAVACVESCPLGFEMATNNRRKKKKARKKINKQAKHRDRTVWGWTLLILTSANANANACLSNM